MGLLVTSFLVSVDGKRLDSEGKGMPALSIKSTVEALSARFFQLAKLNNGSGLPPRVHLTIVIPSTTTVGARNFFSLKIFVKNLVQEFSASPSGTRVAMVTQSSVPRLAFNFYQFINMECTLKGISSVRFAPGQTSPLDNVLNFVNSKLHRQLKREKPTEHRILFIIAESSIFNSTAPAALPAKTLKDNGVEVFILTVGKHVTNNGPKEIASNPEQSHVFQVSSFQDLSKLSKAFKGKGFSHSCSGEGIVYDECNRRCHCKDGQLTDCYRIRKDFTEMSFGERRRFVRAFKAVSKDPPYRSTYDLVTVLHPHFFESIHEKELFFPWHRWYLLVFENLLRHVDCRVTVPYWNWARAVSRKRLWRHTGIRDIWNPGSHGLGGNGESRTGCVRSGPFKIGKWSLPKWLNSDCLSRDFDYKTDLPGQWYVEYLNRLPWNKFSKFEDGVRDYMHNDMHNAIGGTMSEDESAVAPEFWCHHAFLDKIWSDWQDHGPRYKFAYYRSVNKTLPGGTHFGWEFMDLQNQPHCVRILYEKTRDENDFDDNDDDNNDSDISDDDDYEDDDDNQQDD